MLFSLARVSSLFQSGVHFGNDAPLSQSFTEISQG